ncbi:CRM family member 2 [Perilla frutescens var. hirtella]|uniref:CRM family member 2 n=1 Tax=Perilla frutescens var. hirtella TaxID=608512 RepID=A0AAD4P815_PERFH|nr:CRM family member 2 [Perilla frutescens var. hirtella]
MLVPLCNCNRHFSFLPPKTLLKPLPQNSVCNYPNFPLKPFRRRISVSAGSGGGGADTQTLPQSAIQRIAEKLRSLGYVEDSSSDASHETSISGANSPGDIFVPFPTRLPKYRVGHTLDSSWSTPENPVPEPGSGKLIQRFHELKRRVVEEEEREGVRKRREGAQGRRESAPSLAELTLPAEELRRLRSVGIGLRKKLKLGKAGIKEGIVNGIHERWRRSEVVKIMCEDICRLNMKRTHELLEKKTGGLVIWRSGSHIILYRGVEYKYPYFVTDKLSDDSSSKESPDIDKNQRILSTSALVSSGLKSDTQAPRPSLIQGVGLPNRARFQLPGEAQLAEEADALLEGLGPRFSDWWGCDPLPVDADCLPAVVPGYRKPFRLLPYGVKPKLTNDEMTTLRRLGRPFPCHFALGRNRKLQGLAAAILKLWEKCEIAKIAIKRGVQNTNSELIAEEIKWLTGGSLLSRDKEFIVFYRGKDFLPAAVSSAIEERRRYGLDVSKTVTGNLSIVNEQYKSASNENAAEAEQDKENVQKWQDRIERRKVRSAAAAMERTSTNLSMALAKKARAEKLLADLEEEQTLQPPPVDKEGITEEERHMLRKVGLRMKPFLLLGRRGVFDGTVENMHLHWKYRELVKVCIGKRSIEEVHEVARILEAESGGILVAVEPVSKGYVIIVYRGKNYTRPASLRPRSLLSKREAMKRSLEAQRHESLKLHVLKLNRHIDALKLKMDKNEDINDMQLTKDLKPGAVDQENNEHCYDNDKISHRDSDSDCQSYFEDPADEARETGGTDATVTDPEDCVHTTKETLGFSQQNLPRDDSVGPEAKGKYLFDKVEPGVHHKSLPKGTKDFASIKQQIGNVGRPQDRTRGSTPSYTQSRSRAGKYNAGGNRNAELGTTVQKAVPQSPPSVPSRALQLSNKERLLLRKQALKIKRAPLLAVGKSNVITGVAKSIKEHFEKHPLAIVSIKGRAKGTSAREVIYNLEQATGAILVSQEPSKVILYRGWGSGIEPSQASGKGIVDLKRDSMGGEVTARPIISPELISAIRLECGLISSTEERVVSEATADGRTDDIPSND